MLKKMISILLALTLALSVMAGCGENQQGVADTTEKTTIPQPDYGLTLTQGQTMSLKSEALTGDIRWEVSNPARATVDENGTVTALTGRGVVTVTATDGEKSENWEIKLCEDTPYGLVNLTSGDGGLTIGVWNGSYHEIDDFHMELLSMAGINLLIGLEERWLVAYDMEEILDSAESYGISIIEDMRNWDGVDVPDFTDHPALAGYLMYDEPCSTEYDKLAQLLEKFRQVMPEDKLFYVNLFPEACSYESLYGDDWRFLGKPDYEEHYLKPVIEKLDVPYISYDAYALQEGGRIRPSYYHNFDVVTHHAQKNGMDFWYTLLSSPHSTTDGRYIDPTDREMRWQMALGMTYGSKDLAHYVLCSHETDDYDTMIEYGTWETTRLYDDISLVNNEFLAWDDIFTSYTWQGTAKVDTGMKNAMLLRLEYDVPLSGAVTEVSSDQDLLVGVFDRDGQSAYMITGAGDTSPILGIDHQMNFTMEDANAVLTLEGDYRCAAVISKGQITYVPVTDNTVRLTVEAYDGVFVIPVP